jgi:Zn-dependent membrane protease YugP
MMIELTTYFPTFFMQMPPPPAGGSGGGFMGIPMGYILIMGGTMLLSFLVSSTLKRRFNEYSQIPLRVTGAQVAEMMLRQSGIHDVRVIHTPGHLTDHYDPTNKTVNLSESVYHHNSVAAAAVAAHECGHAVQHQKAYAWLGFRSRMVPMVNIASKVMNMVMILGVVGMFAMGNGALIWVIVACLAVTTAFALITLPVEFDASRRAMVWLESSGLANSMEHDRAKNALFWAAMTYVAGAIGSAAMLVYYLMQVMGARREE